MDGWIWILAMVLLTICGLGAARQWRNRPQDNGDDQAWYASSRLQEGLETPPAPRPGIEQLDREFHQRQFRRRMQGTLMIGVLGLLLPMGTWIESGMWRVLYAAGLMSLLGWMLMLAMADLVATRHHFSRVRDQLLSDMLASAKTAAAPTSESETSPTANGSSNASGNGKLNQSGNHKPRTS